MPPVPASSGSANRRRSRSSPRSNSRRASSPTTKKKSVIRPLLTHPRRSSDTPASPSWTDRFVPHSESYDEPSTFTQRSAATVAASRIAATVAALLWVNVDGSSYDSLWGTNLSVQLGDAGVSLDLRGWVNSGLMTLFFFVVGLEARREFDLGELRDRRRVALPLAAGIGGMVVPIAIFLAFNAGRPSAHGWGVAMSTDTAFALGLLALVGPRFRERLRAYMLTVLVADDLISLIVIATVYPEHFALRPLLVALALLAAV